MFDPISNTVSIVAEEIKLPILNIQKVLNKHLFKNGQIVDLEKYPPAQFSHHLVLDSIYNRTIYIKVINDMNFTAQTI